METKVFYVVWCPGAGSPCIRHDSQREAKAEAERLACANPGREFIVLKAISISRSVSIETIALCVEGT